MGLFGGGKAKERKALEQFLAAPSVDGAQVDLLKQACPNAQADLYDILKTTKNSDHRFRALIGLQMLGVTNEMIPLVVNALQDPDDFVQEAAAKIIRAHPEHAEAIMPALIGDYREHPAIRFILLDVLTEFGPAAHSAAPVVRESLARPLEALAAARCLAHIGTEGLDETERGLVDLLADRRAPADLKALGPGFERALETFLMSCVPWRLVDAIPAWRRALEAYAAIVPRPAPALMPVLTELAQFSDWKLRGEVSAQFLDMSRAKAIAAELVQRT